MASLMNVPAPVDDASALGLWGRVSAGFVATSHRLHAGLSNAFDLTDAEAETLLTLYRNAELRVPMATLAQAAAFTSGGFTKIADKLTGRGLIVRVACLEDRRVTYLELTPDGLELTQRLAHLVADVTRARFIDVLGLDRAALVAEAFQELSDANRDVTG